MCLLTALSITVASGRRAEEELLTVRPGERQTIQNTPRSQTGSVHVYHSTLLAQEWHAQPSPACFVCIVEEQVKSVFRELCRS
jgi:hypothetical protein